MKRIEIVSDIPNENDIMNAKPFVWKIDGCCFETSLFSFYHFELFSTLTRALKLYTQAGQEISFVDYAKIIDDINKKISENNEGYFEQKQRLLSMALEDFHKEYGFLPKTLIELIVKLSNPQNIKNTYKTIKKWYSHTYKQYIYPSPKQFIHSKELRNQWVIEYLRYELSVTDVLELYTKINQINTTVKKKLLGHEAEVQEQGLSPRQKVLLKYQKKQMSA